MNEGSEVLIGSKTNRKFKQQCKLISINYTHCTYSGYISCVPV